MGEINLKSFQEIVTYTARGLEPYRGFPQFYSAIPFILDARPQCHIIIMADDKSCYSRQRDDGKTWLEAMQSIVPAASSERVHFFKFSNYENYRKILRFSTVHIYLTAPFVLSWFLLEAMSCQCLILASATSPVKEVIKHQENGYLTSFWDSNIIAQDAIKLLQENSHLSNIRFNARKTILEKYDVSKSLAAQLQLLIFQIFTKQYLAKLLHCMAWNYQAAKQKTFGSTGDCGQWNFLKAE